MDQVRSWMERRDGNDVATRTVEELKQLIQHGRAVLGDDKISDGQMGALKATLAKKLQLDK
jgi:hypothetical protein